MAGRVLDSIVHRDDSKKIDGRRPDLARIRLVVVKHSLFKGSYTRILSITADGVITQMPNLQVTNVYSMHPEANILRLVVDYTKKTAMIHARPDGKKNAEKTTFLTACPAVLASAVYAALEHGVACLGWTQVSTELRGPDLTVSASKLRKGVWHDCVLRLTSYAVERLDESMTVRWRMRFCDMRSPAILMLDETSEHGAPRKAFKLCGTGQRGQRFYASAHRDGFVSSLVKVAAEKLSLQVVVQRADGSSAEHQAATAAGLAQGGEVPLVEFWALRVRVPQAFWDGSSPPAGAEDGVGRFSTLPKASRLLCVSEGALLEKRRDGRSVSRRCDLRSVAALVCFEWACESRHFAIEWDDTSEPSVFESNTRHKDLALLLDQVQLAKQAAVAVLPDFTWQCRKIIGYEAPPVPSLGPAQRADKELELLMLEQLTNAAEATHDEICRHRIIEFEDALANQPAVVPLSAVHAVPAFGQGLPEMPPVRPIDVADVRLEDVAEDAAAVLRAAGQTASTLAGQAAAAARIGASRLKDNLQQSYHVASEAVKSNTTAVRIGRAIHDAALGADQQVEIPEKHAFLVERLHEFNATIPYSGFSQHFAEYMCSPSNWNRERRRKCYVMLEAIFCLLPPEKKAGQTRLRPEAQLAVVLIAALQALQRLASCMQLQEEMCNVGLFGPLFSLLDCGCDRVAMESARLLTRLWAPLSGRFGSKPFLSRSAVHGQDPGYLYLRPEEAVQFYYKGWGLQVKANKNVCFAPEMRQTRVAALVDGLVASSNDVLSQALIEATAALVAEPESQTSPEAVLLLVKEKLAKNGALVFRLMNTPCVRSSEGIMAIVREVLAMPADAAAPMRDAALDEGVILKHLIVAMSSEPQAAASDPQVMRIAASREFVQRLVEQHPPTQDLLRRIFPSTLLSLLQKPMAAPPTGRPGSPPDRVPSADSLEAELQVAQAPRPAAPSGPNWPIFWRVACNENHSLAGLIWDESTRADLKLQLAEESTTLQEAKKAGALPVWNHTEFSVRYKTPHNMLKVANVYVNLLLDNPMDPTAVSSLNNPRDFFEKLYFHFVYALAAVRPGCAEVESSVNIEAEQLLCVRAMAAVYSEHAHTIAPCACVPYLLTILDETASSQLREQLVLLVLALVSPAAASNAGKGAAKAQAAASANAAQMMDADGVELLVELAAMAHVQSRAVGLGAGAPALLMDRAQADIDAVESWWYYPVDFTVQSGSAPPDTAPGLEEGLCKGPLTRNALLDLVRAGKVTRESQVWAAGMVAPQRVRAVRELRWLLARGAGAVKWLPLSRTCLQILAALINRAGSMYSSAPIVPLPHIIRRLASRRCVPHIAQLMLTHDPELVNGAAKLLLHVARLDSRVLHKLYSFGVFFFALAYVGRDLDCIAELLAATHDVQYFQGVQGKRSHDGRSIGERSILGPMLPESLLHQMETYGPRAFAVQMIRQVDDPEVLWSQAMREEELLPAVHGHLGSFPLQLRDHVLAVYDYTPMPPMTYKALAGELWCHRYYLRKLCTDEFRNHPIVEHLRFRNEIIAEWRKEMQRKAADFSKPDALGAMGMQPSQLEGVTPEEAIDALKRAYRQQALKLHPDKCPEGPEPFIRMCAAYDTLMALAQGEAKEGGGPRPHRLTLLLKTQCLLYRREPDVLGEYTYPAYDLILLLLQETSAESLDDDLSLLCVELMWLTLSSCLDNAPFLADKGAVEVVAALVRRCSAQTRLDAPPTARCCALAALALRCLACIALTDEGRAKLLAMDEAAAGQLLADVLMATRLERATAVAAAALDATAALASAADLQAVLLRKGVLAHLFPRILQFNATDTVETVDIANVRGVGAAAASVQSEKQRAAAESYETPRPDNELAFKAVHALRALCGFASESCPNPECQDIVHKLLTPYAYYLVSDGQPAQVSELLTLLTGEVTNPLIIWTDGMRKQLVDTLSLQLDAPDRTDEDLTQLRQFQYTKLEGELVIADIYVRVYNDDPSFSQLGGFARRLFVELFRYIHRAACALAEKSPTPFTPDEGCPLLEASITDGFAPAPQTARDHLLQAFAAARHLLSSPTYKAASLQLMTSGVVLAPLVCWIKQPCVRLSATDLSEACSESGLEDAGARGVMCSAAEEALRIVATGMQSPDVAAKLNGTRTDGDERGKLLCAHIVRALLWSVYAPCSSTVQKLALELLLVLAEFVEPARVTVESGGAMLLLAVVFPAETGLKMDAEQQEASRQVRVRAVRVLQRLLTQQSAYQQQLELLLVQVLPRALVQAFKATSKGGAEVVVQVDQEVDSPELVWTAAMRSRTVKAITRLAEQARSASCEGGTWALEHSEHVTHPELDFDAYIGGVYLRRFLDTTKVSSGQSLRDPASFLDGLVAELSACMDAALARRGAAPPASSGDTVSSLDLTVMIARAAELLLQRYDALPQHAAQQGYVEMLVARLPRCEPSAELREMGGCVLRVLLQLSLHRAAARRLAVPAPPLIPSMQVCMRWSLAASIFALDIMRCALHDSNPDRSEIVNQALVHGFVQQLLGLLEPADAPPDLVPPGYAAGAAARPDDKSKADSDSIKSLVVEVVHRLLRPDERSEQVEEVIAQYQHIWAKHQRNSGVIDTRSEANGQPVPVATLLRGPTNVSTFALPAPVASNVKFIKSAADVAAPAEPPHPVPAPQPASTSRHAPTSAAAPAGGEPTPAAPRQPASVPPSTDGTSYKAASNGALNRGLPAEADGRAAEAQPSLIDCEEHIAPQRAPAPDSLTSSPDRLPVSRHAPSALYDPFARSQHSTPSTSTHGAAAGAPVLSTQRSRVSSAAPTHSAAPAADAAWDPFAADTTRRASTQDATLKGSATRVAPTSSVRSSSGYSSPPGPRPARSTGGGQTAPRPRQPHGGAAAALGTGSGAGQAPAAAAPRMELPPDDFDPLQS